MGVNAEYVLHCSDNDIRKKTRSKCVCLARGSCEIPVSQEHVIKKTPKTSQFQVYYEYLS